MTMRFILVLMAAALPAFGHDLSIDFELAEPEVLLRASYGPGQPAAQAAVRITEAGGAQESAVKGETASQGEFAFIPPHEGDWAVQVDDGYGHMARRSIIVDWQSPATPGDERPSLWTRAGAGLVLIFGVTAIFVWGKRRDGAVKMKS